jgi:hypothetical protein
VERVAGGGEVAQHHGPDTCLASNPPGHVQTDVVSNLQIVLGEQVVQPLVVDHGQIVPLRQIEPEHAHTAVPEPVDRQLLAQVVERHDQDGMPRVDPARGARRSSPQGNRGGKKHDGGPGQ